MIKIRQKLLLSGFKETINQNVYTLGNLNIQFNIKYEMYTFTPYYNILVIENNNLIRMINVIDDDDIIDELREVIEIKQQMRINKIDYIKDKMNE